METPMNTEVVLLIGKVEGKVDTLISLNSATAARVDQLEQRVSAGEVEIASLKAKATTNQSVITNITAFLALIVAAISAYVSYK